MKWALSLVMWASFQTSAGEFAGSSGMAFDLDEVERVSARPVAKKPVVVAAPTTPTNGIAAPPISAASSTGTGRGCLPPRPYKSKEETVLKIYVDQQRQVMTVQSPDFPTPVEFPVSTGGGLKIPTAGPDGKPKDPYYACTPELKERVITGFEPSDFAGRADCSPEDVRFRSTMFFGDSYRSATFTTESGEGVVMPNALRVTGGIFIHKVPRAYKKLIGRNVSGECIRVPEWHEAPDWIQAIDAKKFDTKAMTARDVRITSKDGSTRVERQLDVSETLYKQMKKHGSMMVSITPPPDAVCHLPLKERQERALADAGRMPVETKSTGTEGVIGGIDDFFSNLGKLFSGTGSRPQPSRPYGDPAQPPASSGAPVKAKPAPKASGDKSWMQDAFKGGS